MRSDEHPKGSIVFKEFLKLNWYIPKIRDRELGPGVTEHIGCWNPASSVK